MYQKVECDIAVVGGGPGGIMAALAAARCGAEVLLIEQGAFLGGTPTRSVLGPISPFHFQDEQIIQGIAGEFISKMVKSHGATGHMKCMNPTGTGSYVCFYDHEIYEDTAQKMLEEAGVSLLFHGTVLETVMRGRRIETLRIESRFGGLEIHPKIVVDATGDGDIAALSGEKFVLGDGKGGMQPGSLMFEMAGVDTNRLYRYIQANREEFARLSDIIPVGSEKLRPRFVAQGYRTAVEKARKEGSLIIGRDSIQTASGFHPGWVHFNSVRVEDYGPLELERRSASEQQARVQMHSIAEFMRREIPGFEHAYIARAGIELGVRESRHIRGKYTLTGEDAVSGRKFRDAVARGGFPIDIHGGKGEGSVQGTGGIWRELRDCYDIPYRSLVPETTEGLLLAGRCISGTHEASASFRTQGVVMGFSQAAGVAAALCVQQGKEPGELSAPDIQRKLTELGASPFRSQTEKEKAERQAARAVQKFAEDHPDCITPSAYLKPYIG